MDLNVTLKSLLKNKKVSHVTPKKLLVSFNNTVETIGEDNSTSKIELKPKKKDVNKMASSQKLNQSHEIFLPSNKLNNKNKTNSTRSLRSDILRPDKDAVSLIDDDTNSPVSYALKECFEPNSDERQSTPSESFYSNDKTDILNIRIFFPNGKAIQFSVEDGMHVCSTTFIDLVAEHLSIDLDIAKNAFALWLISPLLEVQLKPHHVPFEVYKKWPVFLRKFTISEEDEIILDEPLLVIRRNFQLNIANERLYIEQYERLVEVLYLDAKDQYMSGRYLVNVEEAIQLAALQLSIEFELFENKEQALDLIENNLGLLVPPQHLSTIRTFRLFGLSMIECKSGLENMIVDEYETVSKRFCNNYERRKYYLNILQKTPFYGAVFFNGIKERKQSFFSSLLRRNASSYNVVVGINHEYITVVHSNRNELIMCQLISNCSWSRSPDSTNENEIPLFLLQYPDGSTLCDQSNKKISDKIGLGHFVSVELRKNVDAGSENKIFDENLQKKSKKSLKQNFIVQRPIFSKQAIMMETLLNSLYNELYLKINVVQ